MLIRGIRRDSHRRMVVTRTRPHDGFALAGTGTSAVAEMSGHSMLTRGIRRESHRRIVVAKTWPHEGLPATSTEVIEAGAGRAWPSGRTLPDGIPRRPRAPMLLPSSRIRDFSGTAEYRSEAPINRHEPLRLGHSTLLRRSAWSAPRGGVAGEDPVADRRPLKRVADAFGDVVLWSPAEQAHRTIDAGISASNVTRSASRIARLDRVLGDEVERVEKF